MWTVRLAKLAMRSCETAPSVDIGSLGGLNELFRHPLYLDASEEEREAIRLGSALSKFESERQYPWDSYFGRDLTPFLRDKKVLDLGCLVGGRSVAWLESYGLAELHGIDVSQVYIDAANEFAAHRQVNAAFVVARGEGLPFEDESFDAVLSFDVFEHVQDVAATLSECRRVLKTGGRLFVVFPSYFHPKEHHLDLVTKALCLHWLFSGRTLIEAYNEIIEERGAAADWYRREPPELKPWERGNTINGMTLARFRSIVASHQWRRAFAIMKPIGSVGRNVSRRREWRLVARLVAPLLSVPVLQEYVLHRITYVLEK